MKAVGPPAPLVHSPFADVSKSSFSPNGELQPCPTPSQIQIITSSKSLFGLRVGKCAVLASLRRLGSAFGLDKLNRTPRESSLNTSKDHTIASSVHGGCQHRSFAEVILSTRLRHSCSTLDLDQVDDPSTRPSTPERRLPFITVTTSTPAAAATNALSPNTYGNSRRAWQAHTGTFSRLFTSPMSRHQAAAQSGPLWSLQNSCVSDQLAQFQHRRVLVKSSQDHFNAATNLEASLSAPPNFPQLQQECAASSASAELKPQPQPAAETAAAVPAPPWQNVNSEQSEPPRAESSTRGKRAEGNHHHHHHHHQQQQQQQQEQRQAVHQPSHHQPGSSLPLLPVSVPGQTQGSSEPGTLLGMLRSLPPEMRRSTWSIGDYSVTRRLFKGDRTAVYKAICKRSGLPVALKVYFLSRTPQNTLHQVAREIQIQLSLNHTNVLTLYGAFQDSKRLVLVMELAARGDLFSLKSAMDRPLSEEQLQHVVLEPLLDALSYMHGKGICHRDIKPENLLFTSDWGFRLADFGVSINMMEERAVTRAGTADYMAPEVERCPLKTSPHDNKQDVSLAYTTAVVRSIRIYVRCMSQCDLEAALRRYRRLNGMNDTT
ncbi:hypothetical protein Vafri_16423 [Volvox africanus]|uniref:Protein kinase domain-containing protein n=1 Tax=Volvox africanus TaxID=51714 RepID=A0A8J4F903_9CHLO|nr:hypothetical protein Vafri_16423 [Volvox africanus]